MRPFRDITIYYSDRKTPDFDSLNNPNHFRQTVNFICDFYHQLLNGYKPLKTSRLCINFTQNFSDLLGKPTYFGSICSIGCYFEEDKYLTFSGSARLQYLLDLLHSSVIITAHTLGWDEKVFQKAYSNIIDVDFQFMKEYPKKLNRTQTYTGQVVLEKDIFTSKIYFVVSDVVKNIKKEALVRDNGGYLDSSYFTCKRVKWLNKTDFGVEFKNFGTDLKEKKQKVYYSIEQNKMCFEGF